MGFTVPGFTAAPSVPGRAGPAVGGVAAFTAIPGFVPFGFVPPTESPDLSGLDLDALKQLEVDERAAVLKRVKFLRRFRSEVDALLARFGQYEALTRATSAGPRELNASASAAASLNAEDGA